MKKFVLALTALSAFVAAPAMARSDTHISFGFYSPAPVYYEPAPVVYYPPVNHVYYAPRVAYCPPHYGYGVGYSQGYGYRGHHGHGRAYDTAWNAPRYNDYDRDDRHDYGYGRR